MEKDEKFLEGVIREKLSKVFDSGKLITLIIESYQNLQSGGAAVGASGASINSLDLGTKVVKAGTNAAATGVKGENSSTEPV